MFEYQTDIFKRIQEKEHLKTLLRINGKSWANRLFIYSRESKRFNRLFSYRCTPTYKVDPALESSFEELSAFLKAEQEWMHSVGINYELLHK